MHSTSWSSTLAFVLVLALGVILPASVAAQRAADGCRHLSGRYQLDAGLSHGRATTSDVLRIMGEVADALDAGGWNIGELRLVLGLKKIGVMSTRLVGLASATSSLITAAQVWGSDVQIGVVTTDPDDVFVGRNPGELVGHPRICVPPQAAAALGDTAGNWGGDDPFDPFGDLMDDPGSLVDYDDLSCVARGPRSEASFLREDAALEIIFVSDEPEQSMATVEFYVDLCNRE